MNLLIMAKNGTTKNVVIMGDSGAGKSESLEALAEMAGDNISSQLTKELDATFIDNFNMPSLPKEKTHYMNFDHLLCH